MALALALLFPQERPSRAAGEDWTAALAAVTSRTDTDLVMDAPGGAEGGEGGEPTATGKAQEDLRAALDQEGVDAATIQAKLTALREAREQAKQELATAQSKLREVLTLKQEAHLILMGLLD